jgi:hypothetical protein
MNVSSCRKAGKKGVLGFSNGLVIAPTEQRAGHLQVLTLVP